MNNRDDFSEKGKRAIAARAGWHCSFAGCAKLTVRPAGKLLVRSRISAKPPISARGFPGRPPLRRVDDA